MEGNVYNNYGNGSMSYVVQLYVQIINILKCMSKILWNINYYFKSSEGLFSS